LVVMDKNQMFLVSGSGEVIEPDDNVLAIGSGGAYALAAARALLLHSQLDAHEIAVESLKIAAGICVFTNQNITVEELGE
ncbi:MAG: HslU--HslV peptidase proteolytic subunit, partial [Bacillota bacterium]